MGEVRILFEREHDRILFDLSTPPKEIFMPLLLEEIMPGVVAILETPALLGNNSVQRSLDDIPFRAGPFLCVQVVGDRSTWLNITTKKDARGLRVELKPEWLLDGSDIWRGASQYVHDARKTFVGPNSAFVTAGANEIEHTRYRRPRVSDEGVAAAMAGVRKFRANAL